MSVPAWGRLRGAATTAAGLWAVGWGGARGVATTAAPARAPSVPAADKKIVRVGIIGAPNAGKSVLSNVLVDGKVSAVSPKTNTTRREAVGAFTAGASQLALYDTPGVVGPDHYRSADHQGAVASAWKVASHCDVLLFLVDAHRQVHKPDPRVMALLTGVGEGKAISALKPLEGISYTFPASILLLNKVDMFPPSARGTLESLAEELSGLGDFAEVRVISALQRDGTDELRADLLARAQPGEWVLPAGRKTPMSVAQTALEVVREQVFRRVHQDLPYEIDLVHVSQRQLADGSVRIEQAVMVQHESQKRIVVGRGGRVIGEIGVTAGRELEGLLGRRVHLVLRVKVAR